MKKSPVSVLLCSYSAELGWRIMGSSRSDSAKVGIFRFGSIKLLKIPVVKPIRAGLFCNPKKQVESFLLMKE